MNTSTLDFDIEQGEPKIIKVIGVGGGGGNAVAHMYKEGIHDVSFLLCNTDKQALRRSGVPNLLVLGETITKGLGAGNNPEVAKRAAEESEEDIKQKLDDGTQMVFITAGMGGGTGTGAAPVIARITKDMDILTVGIVTIPFAFEGEPKILQALYGVEEIRKNVDALLVISNERMLDIDENMSMIELFAKANNTLTMAAKSIAEIITIPGIINLDFADVKTTLKSGDVALMSNGYGEGANRFQQAIDDALNSPLLNNNDVFRAKKILFNISASSQVPVLGKEMARVREFMSGFDSKNIKVIWGLSEDDTLGSKIKITLLATGFGANDIHDMDRIRKGPAPITEADIRAAEKKDQLLKDYGYDKLDQGKTRASHSKAVILSDEELDMDDFISLLEDHPPYKRDPKIILKYRAEAKRNSAGTNLQRPSEPEERNSDRIITF
ncbi:MAG: cell division protein FtsZ [Tannerellaceae bacterium]|jgi:cell division protein FtsZ|nr:cell division protein FtsZ [Tannerellaceae bacterium]